MHPNINSRRPGNSGARMLFVVVGTLLLAALLSTQGRSAAVFAWACFVKPILGKMRHKPVEQQQALELFYETQAHVYDRTRRVLLKGREECLQLAASHIPTKNGKLVWVDVGGGTGNNIEMMDQYLPLLDNFAHIYLVDLSPSLCNVARKRFSGKKWEHLVTILVTDAADFSIEKEADLITFSYSLLMIPTFNSVVDHAVGLLNKENGVVASVDFGIQSSDTSMGRVNTLGGLLNRNVSWLSRNFWRVWFEADKIFLDSARRNYLEYKFGTLKSLNEYNRVLGRIPYYVWIGCDKTGSKLLLHKINCLATESPYLAPSDETQQIEYPVSKGHEAAVSNFRKNLPFPSTYYQRQPWRVYYDEINPSYHQFRDMYIYGFTWEDPREDHKILKFSSQDTVLAITSAGDNILSYASLPDPPNRIHAVDLNPAQNHLLELKLAALKTLSKEQMWQMFGNGKVDNFRDLLFRQLSSSMSSQAFQFWQENEKTFDPKGKGLYDTGSTRWALRLARAIFVCFGVGKYIDSLCSCTNIKDQIQLWNDKIKPTLLNPFVATLLVGNPLFLWKALGVPANQAEMMGDSVFKYVVDTLDPVIHRLLISTDNYFYYLTLKGHYARNNCPDYLTEKGMRQLTTAKNGSAPIDRIRLHTDTLNDVFARLSKKCITIAIIMDHMDWFDPNGDDARKEIESVSSCLVPGGRVMLRSAAQYPWYIKTFESCGFTCKPAAIRHSGKSIDRINMYSSTWVCTKPQVERRVSRLVI